MPAYTDIFRAIHGCGADYAWIGMMAAATHGSPIVSYDYDFFVRPVTEHLDRVRTALRGLGLVDGMGEVHSANVITMEVTISFVDPYGGPTVDVLTKISGPSFEEVWRDSVVREVGGALVRVASLEHIIASKKAANREKDREAIRRLQQEFTEMLRGRDSGSAPAV